MRRSLSLLPLLCVASAASLVAQGPRLAPAPFNDLRFRNIGPAVFGGRFTDIVVARTRGAPDQIYIAASTGGVFKSVNGGASWTPVFDSVNTMMSMGDMAIAPSNQNIVWVATGESANPPHRWGEGVFKSVDAGKTWTFMGLKETRHIGRVVVHPTNPDIVLVAAQGHIFGPSTERGLFKTVDGGRSWKRVLFVDENTGANDVAFDPSNPNIILASAYQRQRKSFGGIPTGPGSGLYKSTDGGETWTKVTKGLPETEKGRIGIFFSPVDPKLVYADVEVRGALMAAGSPGNAADCPPEGGRSTATRGGFDSGDGGVYRSLDGGDTWEHVYARIDQPSGFFIQMRADPQDRNRVYRLGTGFYVSDDMGKTWRTLQTNLHGDYFALWIDPEDNNHLIISNDGGLAISRDRGLTWDHRSNIPVAQFYETWIDNRDPYWVCGGLQDNGMWCTPSAVRDRNGISHKEPWTMGGGDGMHVRVDPHDTTFAVFESQSGAGNQGNMQRLNLVTRQRQTLKPGIGRPLSCYEEKIHAAGRVQPPLRWGWDTPILFSPTVPGVLYTAAQVVFKSTDRGASWRVISPDLTAQVNRDTVFIMGRKLGAANYSPNGTNVTDPTVTPTFGQITWLGESPLNAQLLYAGSEDGMIHVTRDGGANWTSVGKNVPELPPFSYVSTVLPSHHAAGRVYATMERSKSQDDKAYVYVSENYGQTWRAITNGLPVAPVYRIAEHPRDPNLLVVAHVRGVHFSNDRGATWHSLNTNMPTVPVTSVVFHPRDNALVVGTYGRGIYILDDAGPLQSLTAEALRSEAVLASTTTGRQWALFSSGPTWGVGGYTAPNPDFDAGVSYYIRDGAAGNATITFANASGVIVRTMSGPASKGLHRVTWDMRMDGAAPEGVMQASRGRGGASGALGPLVLPGRYTVTVRAPGLTRELRGSVQVAADPMERISEAARTARHSTVLQLYAIQKRLMAARVEGNAQSLSAPMQKAQMELNRLLGITGTQMRAIESFNSAPTADQRQQIVWLEEDVTRLMRELQHARGGAQ